MESKDKKRFATAMAVMGECFQKEPSKTMSEVYWRALQDLSIDAIEKAADTLINTRKITGTFPLVAEIREAVEGPLESRAAIAWDKALYALHQVGTYESVKFDDPIIAHIIVQWGGWTEFGDWTVEQTKWRRKEFIQIYEAYVRSGNLPEPADHLIGEIEYKNSAKGFVEKIPQPYLITGRPGEFRAERYQGPAQITQERRRIE